MPGRRRVKKLLEATERFTLVGGSSGLQGIEARPRTVRVRGHAVGLDWTPCPFGGERAWFLCPKCRRRCRVLHRPAKSSDPWSCRRCLRLAYATQSLPLFDRLLAKRDRAVERLGAPGGQVMGRTFEKPKWMRRSTFERLWQEALDAEVEALLSLRGWLKTLDE
jgi:hypothetical protein